MALPKVGVQLVLEDTGAFFSDLKRAQDGIADLGKANVSGAGFDAIGQAARGAAGDIKKTGDAARDSGGGFSALREVGIGALREIGAAAVTAGAEVAKAIGAGIAGSVTAAGDFESAVNNFAAVSGDALAQAGFGFDDVKAKALELGQTTAFSASESIAALTELVKGGVPVAAVMDEATGATLNLAAAAGVDLANAAEIVAKQYGVWADTGLNATQISDLLTQAANASTVGVEDLALGLANVGGVAKVTGLGFGELTQTMALIAPGFSSAADAGTSLKTFLTSLLPATTPAKDAMADLGLFTEETGSAFFNASGEFVGMEQAAALLQGSLAGLSAEQQQAALKAIFGQDAFRAAALIAEAGAPGFTAMGEAMAGAGTAAEVAAIQNQGFNFAMDSLKGSLETLQIVVGSALLPILTQLIDGFTAGVGQVSTFFQAVMSGQTSVEGLTGPLAAALPIVTTLVDAFMEAGPFSLEFAESLSLVHPALQPLMLGLMQVGSFLQANWQPVVAAAGAVLAALLVPAIAAAAAAFGAAVVAAAPVIAVLAGVGAAAAALQGAWENNFGGIREATAGAMAAVQNVITQVLGVITTFWESHGAEITAFAQTTWTQIQQIVGSGVSLLLGIITPVLNAIAGFISAHGDDIQAVLKLTWDTISTIVSTVIENVQGIINIGLALLKGDWQGAWDEVKGIVDRTFNAAKDIVQGVWDTVKGIWDRNSDAILAKAKEIWDGVKTAVTDVVNAIPDLVDDFVSAALDLGQGIIDGIVDGVKGGVGALIGAVRGAASDALAEAKKFLGIQSPSRVFADAVGEPIPQGMARGIDDATPVALKAIRNLTDGAISIAKPIVTNLLTIGQDGARAFGAGFGIAAEESLIPVADWHVAMGEAFGVATDDAFSSGESIAEGLAKGIQAGAAAAASAAEKLAAGVTSSAQTALDISSPSGIFAEEVGRPVVQGWAQGMLDNLGILIDAAAEISSAVLEEATAFASTIQDALGPILADAYQGAADFAGSQLTALDVFDDLLPDTKALDKLSEQIQKLNAKNNALIGAGVGGPELQAVREERARLIEEYGRLDRITAEQQAIARQAQADIVAAQKEALALSNPAERAAFLDQAIGGIEAVARARQALAGATTDRERQFAAERLRLTEEQVKYQTLLYQQEARDRQAAQQQALREAEDALKQLGSLVYFSQQDVFGAGQDAIRGLTSGMLAELANLKGALGSELGDVLGYLKRLLGIASPSRLFAAELGAPMGEGIVAGARGALMGLGRAVAADLMGAASVAGATIRPAVTAAQRAGGGGVSSSTISNWTYAPTYMGGAPPAEQNIATMQILATR